VIVDLPATSTGAISQTLIDLRQSGGAVALGRVLTLVIVTDDTDVEEPIQAANDASREHPCRIVVLAAGNPRAATRLDGQVRVGGDAGASEVIVLRSYGRLVGHLDALAVPFLLSDAPVVAWWPTGAAPAVPADDPVGRLAGRRITDAQAARRPRAALQARRAGYRPGDTDLAWTRVTNWRGVLAAALDQPPVEEIRSASVTGGSDSPSADLLAAWLAVTLGVPVRRGRAPAGAGLVSVRLQRSSGPLDLVRSDGRVATLSQPGWPDRHMALPRRTTRECLAEELRRLDPDEVFAAALLDGLPVVTGQARETTTGQES
jgi:glucose-6-phosphate dehydrogenase assembly protein OpcA